MISGYLYSAITVLYCMASSDRIIGQWQKGVRNWFGPGLLFREIQSCKIARFIIRNRKGYKFVANCCLYAIETPKISSEV
jgi:hypothetical protein